MHQRALFGLYLFLLLCPATASHAAEDKQKSTAVVEGFLREVWQGKNPEAVDKYVIDDFVISTGGKDIRSREAFKLWVAEFQSKIADMKLEIIETIANADGSRVVTRLRLTGRNNGMFDLPKDQKPFVLTATAVWAVNTDGRLAHNWVERNAGSARSASRRVGAAMLRKRATGGSL